MRARPTSKPLAHTFTARCPAATARLLKQVTFGDFPAFICLASMLLEFVIGNAVVARGFSSYLVSNLVLVSKRPVHCQAWNTLVRRWKCCGWSWLLLLPGEHLVLLSGERHYLFGNAPSGFGCPAWSLGQLLALHLPSFTPPNTVVLHSCIQLRPACLTRSPSTSGWGAAARRAANMMSWRQASI